MPEPAQQKREYALGHSNQELDRLAIQAKLLEPFTRRVFEQAGLAAGMSVLDVGSGAGDVAFLVREMVGPEGKVIGTDRAPEALQRARERAAALGYSNVTFVQGDPVEMPADQLFDAVVGRFVLMYYPSPAEALRGLARHVGPGGILAFQESDNNGARTFPPIPLFHRFFEITVRTHELSGSDPRMALKLYPAFIAGGLPAPSMEANVGIMGSQDPYFEPLSQFFVQSLRSLMPAILKHGLATEQELDLDTYAQRLVAAFREGGGILISPPFVGAWTRKPG
ncbi:MAG TPA: class I SAM-dependent methyltransferase [Terriglobia bacterium]|nr:class I SAM-dependent methyltransferase [Terriglobia bacterium]